MGFHNRITKLRKALNLNQKQFAMAIHISPSYVSEIESGKKVPSDSLMDLIMARWNVKNEWWEDETGEMFNREEPELNQKGHLRLAVEDELDKLPDEELGRILLQLLEEARQRLRIKHGVAE